MKFHEAVNAELKRREMSVTKLTALVGIVPTNCMEIVTGDRELSQSQAERICSVLGIEWDISQFKPRYPGKVKPPRREDTLGENTRRASELGLSYGQYMTYLATGTLDSYIKRQEQDKKRKYNAIVSAIGGGRGGAKGGASNATRL